MQPLAPRSGGIGFEGCPGLWVETIEIVFVWLDRAWRTVSLVLSDDAWRSGEHAMDDQMLLVAQTMFLSAVDRFV